jgi:hypothetical protein
LPARPGDQTVRMYLPETLHVQVREVTARYGHIAAPPATPRWVVQGDSISQGWSATSPGGVWPARIARRLDIEAINLGFAGSARGEAMAALAVAESGADAARSPSACGFI